MREAKLMTIAKFLAKIFGRVFWRTKIFGKKLNLKKGAVILAGNHISCLDPIILATISQKNLHFFAKKEISEIFLLGFLTKKLGLIFVDRDKNNHDAILLAEKMLHNNMSLAIFPEGTRNPKLKKNNELLPFKIGAVKIAAEAGAPIIPIAISKNQKKFSRIHVRIGEKFFVKKDDNLDLKNEELREIIADLLKKNDVKVRKISGKAKKNPGKISL